MNRPVCFCEAEKKEISRYPEISGSLSREQDLWAIKGDKFQFNFTGILIMNNIPVVVFPKNYRIPEGENATRECATDLVRVLLRYKNEPVHDFFENNLLYGDNEHQSSRISTAIQLMDDFRQYGYINRDTGVLSSTQKGRIDWSATINKTMPVFSHGQPAYFNPLMRYEKTDIRNAVHLIHRFIISDCFLSWGWMYGGLSFVEKENLFYSIDESIMLLSKELRETYIQREVNVIKLMITYLQSKTGSDKKRKLDVLATRYFHFVWEAVCAYLFDSQYSRLRPIIPQPEWDSHIYRGRISQRPDIFTLSASALYILDAKYYNINKNLPGWHDVVKQLFYRHTVKSILSSRQAKKLLPNTSEIYNAFLFPGNNDNPLEYAGRVHVKDTPDLGEIVAFTIDQKKSLRTYAYRNDDIYRHILVSALNDFFKERSI